MIQDARASLAGQIEVRMIGKIDDRERVGRGLVFQRNPMAAQPITGHRGERSRKALIARRAGQRELHPVGQHLAQPIAMPQAVAAAVQGVLAVVAVELHLLLLQREAAVRYAVRKASHRAPQKGRVFGIGLERRVAEHDVRLITLAIRRHQRGYARPKADDLQLQHAVAKGKTLGSGAIRGDAPGSHGDDYGRRDHRHPE